MKNLLWVVAALFLLAANSAQAADKWVTAYYTDWQTSAYPINRIDYTAVTHVVLAHWLTNSNGTIQSSGWDSTCSSVVKPAHAAGVKVLMMLGGSDDLNFPTAASPTNQATLISSIQNKVSACGLDGVDLDWEVSVNTTNFISLAKNLRAANSGYIITAPVDATVQPGSLAASLSNYCDQVNMMSYGNANMGNGWVSWYFSALAGDGTDHPDSIARFVNAWESAGTPAGKIGVGIGFYMNAWSSPVTGALQSTSGSSVPVQELPYGGAVADGGGVLSCYYNKSGGTYKYDPSPALSTEPSTPPEQPSISFPSGFTPASGCPTNKVTWVTYEDEASVAAKAKYIVDNNLGGAIIWTVQEGATDPATGRNPLLDALKLNLNNGSPAPMPQLGTSGAVSVGGPTTLTVTGLPSNLGLVDIKWWNYTSSVAWDSSSDKGFTTYGQPSAYTIQGSTNGSTWTTLSNCSPSCTVTGEHYTGRQFVADLTGTGYTQIRMNISGIVGSNAGVDTLTVNGKAGTNDINDSYLMLGDSITANCWGAASNTGPTEQLGTQIHAARSAQFPASTVGGQSGWLSSTALDTSTYGMPNIQKFMQDMPAVKYVGLSLGTNDANGGISAATYCSNMQKIVQYIIAAGKTPVISTIVASPSSAVQANAPAMNACLATLEQNFPSVIVGPDLWTLFKGHSISDGWFLDDLHPSLGTGCTAYQNAWASNLLSAVYPTSGGSTTPPTVPTNLAATAPKSTQVNLTWTASTDASYATSTLTYAIYRNGSHVATTAAGATSYSNTGLSPSTAYTYTVAAVDPAGNTSAQSTAAKITTPANTTPPSVPANVAATAPKSTQVMVSWTASTDPNYTASQLTYKVYRGGVLVATTAAGATSYSDTTVAASTTYSYTVAAANPAGNTSAQSTAVSVKTPASTPPTVPTGVAATAPKFNQVNVSWTASTDPNYASSVLTYKVYRNGTLVATTAAGAVSYSDNSVVASTTYSYTVAAADPAGNTSAQSTAVSITTPKNTTAPSVPTGVAAAAISSTQVKVSWTASTDPNYTASQLTYKVYRGGALVATTAAGAVSYSDTAVVASTTYSYTVAASNPAGNTSAQSAAVSVTTPAPAAVGAAPTRRGGCATNASSLPTTCTISGVQSGDVILVGFLTQYSASNATITLSDNCGGKYTVLNQHAVQSTSVVNMAGYVVEGQGYGVGSAGTCTISATSSSGGGPAEIVADDITAGKLDTYGWLPDATTTAGGATTFNLNVNHPDYVFTWATDVLGYGGSLKVATPFSAENVNVAFPIYDADRTTTGAGTVASTWTFASNSVGTIGAMAFSGLATAPVISSALTDSGKVGSTLTYQITATGSPTSYSAKNLPAGLAVSSTTGMITGTPTTSGSVSSTISATNSSGTGSATLAFSIAAATTTTSDTTAPSVPAGLTAVVASSSQVNLSWTASTDTNNTASQITYNVYRNGVKVGTTPAGATKYSDSGLLANTTYGYSVSASDPAGNTSAKSGTVNATTPVSSGVTPQRVRGCSAESGTGTASCTLTGVTAGDIIVIGAASLQAGTTPLAFSDNCGGAYTLLDKSNSSNNAVAQGYSTGSAGTCTVTAKTSTGWATTLVVEEITPSSPDFHAWNQNFSVGAAQTASATATTTTPDYVFSWAIDAAGNGGSHMTVASPFAVHDFNNTFPIVDGDTAQASAGITTASWKFNVSTSNATIGILGFH
ncbi:glycosyl hydrolase family 18 protein [Occallatibacter riparius]|uniref:chitinase n=1 Tax=Occallatibacter riparius TaxID=1002689 RepID=A0A9J7BLV2_9BACT|nr:glycosyl hydrolase family 18 protein [Occallatibacter riparius]UWZ83728.1 glycosyl hydrolase family 18 protein [Occallatibacter riparius]